MNGCSHCPGSRLTTYALKNGPELTDSPSPKAYLLSPTSAFCTRSLRLSTIVNTPLSLSSVGFNVSRFSAMKPFNCWANAERLLAIWSSAELWLLS